MTVELPGILRKAMALDSVDLGEPRTVADALAAMRAHPKLGPLIFDESRALRRHVLVFVNDTAIQHLPSLEVELRPTDRVAVVQAVSGG